MRGPTSGPTKRCSIHVAPPPGWMPSFWKRGSNSAAGPAMPNVGGQRQVQSRRRRTVHGRDRGQRAVGDGEEAVVDHPQAVLGRVTKGGEIGTRAERLARPGHDHRVHVGVVLRRLDRRAQRRGDVRRDRVAAIGVVERDQRDAVLDLRHIPDLTRFRLATARAGSCTRALQTPQPLVVAQAMLSE